MYVVRAVRRCAYRSDDALVPRLFELVLFGRRGLEAMNRVFRGMCFIEQEGGVPVCFADILVRRR